MDNIPSATSQTTPDWPELRQQRRAIVVVDVVESVRLMQANEADVIDRWRRFVHEVRTLVLPSYKGRLVKSLGDGMLLEFEAAPQAIAAATRIQRRSAELNAGRTPDTQIGLRIGINVAEVVVDEFDIYGAGVNLAARLATLASADQIVVSASAKDALIPGFDPLPIDLGECYLKHIERPVRAFRLAAGPGVEPIAPRVAEQATPLATSIIVMPIECVAETALRRMVGDVVGESLTAALSTRPELRVISRLSALALAGRTESTDELLRGLQVDYAVMGRCLVTGDQVSVSFDLIDVRRGAQVWSSSFNAALPAILQPHCEMIEQVCSAIASALVRVDVIRATTQPLPTLESHAIQVGAVSFMHQSSFAQFDRVRDMLESLIERHARIAAPRAWLAKWYVLRATRGLATDYEDEARRALDHTRRAIDADPNCSLALAMEGFVHCHLLRDLDTAAERLAVATSVGPSDSLAWLFRGVVHAFRDEGAAAMDCVGRAQALSPADPLHYYFDSLSAAAALAAGQFDRAVELAQRSLTANASHTSTHRTLAIALALSGQEVRASQAVQKLLALDPTFTVARFLARVPSGPSPIGLRFAQALADAGVPQR
jgi:adenylate cyclase